MKTFLKIGCSVIAIMAVTSTPASADPISMAIASTASAVFGTAGGIGAFTFMGLSAGWTSVLASVAVRSALGFALNALTKRPKAESLNRGYNVNTLGPALAHQIVYGKTRVGGAVFYQASSNGNKYLHRCIAVAGHEIESYETIYLNDEPVTLDGSGNVTSPSKYNGYVRIKKHLGSDTQLADPDLVADVMEWTDAHRARGIAYLYVRFYNDLSVGAQSAFPNGVPVVTAVVKGKKVYDSRTTTTAWSNNPAMCLRDYLTSPYGLDESGAEIDDALVEESANVCDETTSDGDARYTCNGSFLLDAAPQDVVTAMTSAMGGTFWFLQGKWAMRAAKYVPPIFWFDEHDLRTNLRIETKHSRRDNFNVVEGVFRGPATDYQEDDYEPVTDAAFVSQDGNVSVSTQLDLLFTDTERMARRIAKIALRRNRQQKTITAGFGLRALNVKIGDTLMLSNDRAGWADKQFEVVDWRFGLTDDLDLATNMVLREIDTTVFQ